jgi:hypothetical protein
MATQLYVMPIAGIGTDVDPRRPKYENTDLTGHAWAAMDFGNEPVMLVATATNAALAAELDVLTIPVNLDQNLTSGAVTTAQTFMENLFIPADWITTSLTYRQVVRQVCQFFMLWQRCQGLGFARIFTAGVTLNTTFGSLPANVRTILTNAAQSMHLDTSSLSGASTIRQIIKAIAPQISGPIHLLDITL